MIVVEVSLIHADLLLLFLVLCSSLLILLLILWVESTGVARMGPPTTGRKDIFLVKLAPVPILPIALDDFVLFSRLGCLQLPSCIVSFFVVILDLLERAPLLLFHPWFLLSDFTLATLARILILFLQF